MSSDNDSDTSSRQQLLDMINGFKVTQLISVVAKLGIADLLELRPKTAGELAAAVGVDVSGSGVGSNGRLSS